jgi:hypothetical protein
MAHSVTFAKHFALLIALSVSWTVSAAPFAEGPKKCLECHEAEYEVWKGTQHAKSYKGFHKRKDAKKIVAAIGGGKSVKKNATCALCHYTVARKKATSRAKAVAGPSCESCHGASSDWRKVHNDYGGNADAKTESAAHKKERLAAAKKAGMTWSFMRYDIATGCMECHGLANPNLDAGILAKMLDAGHPLKPDFELVKYSQGTVRHRFYPPNVNSNQKLDKAGLSRLFIEGQMAKLVSATAALSKSKHPGYVKAQKARAGAARSALGEVKSVASLKAFLASPNDANARKVEAAIKGKDLTREVGSLLPSPGSYK